MARKRSRRRRILVYTLVLIAITLLPFAWGTFGVVYAVSALALGGVFLALTLRLRSNATRPRAAFLFHYSLLYLALLFVAMAIDVL